MPENEKLQLLLVEDLAKFHFAERYVPGKRVLDAGCGAGQGTTYLAGHGATDIIGVDIALEAVAFARSRSSLGNLAFGAMDVARLGFRSGTFDMVTSIEVIEHLVDPEQYVAEIRRVLKDDGLLVLTTPNKLITSPKPGMMWPYHVHEFYPDELYALLGRYFSQVEQWGMCIPVYESHPARKLVHRLAPIFKPILPHKLRTGFLPWLQSRIKSDLTADELQFSQAHVEEMPTLVAVCRT